MNSWNTRSLSSRVLRDGMLCSYNHVSIHYAEILYCGICRKEREADPWRMTDSRADNKNVIPLMSAISKSSSYAKLAVAQFITTEERILYNILQFI